MQMLLDIFAQIFRTLWVHKLRSFLTMFGIAWGVGSLLLLVGLGEGFRSGNKRELAQYGKDIMFIFPGRAPAVQGSMNSARSYLLTYQDYVDISKGVYIRRACPICIICAAPPRLNTATACANDSARPSRCHASVKAGSSREARA